MYNGEYIAAIKADDLDSLIVRGIRHIKKHGERFKAAAGTGLQAHSIIYILNDSRQRVHNIRNPEALRYLCRELIAYFKGSLNIKDGLAQASSYWKNMADNSGRIYSNYGYYVFHQKAYGQNQYDWVVSHLRKNKQSRQALISINQNYHKNKKMRDFPCAIAIQFLVRDNYLCCEISSRSSDIIYGLPYDLGFFSFLNELVCADLNQNCERRLELGYTMLKCSFAQIYDRTVNKAEEILRVVSKGSFSKIVMPPIDESPLAVLRDIYHKTQNSKIINWIYEHAELNKK